MNISSSYQAFDPYYMGGLPSHMPQEIFRKIGEEDDQLPEPPKGPRQGPAQKEPPCIPSEMPPVEEPPTSSIRPNRPGKYVYFI